MAMYKCPECKSEISTSASRCPKCGKKLKHTGLYIVLSLFVATLAILIGIILALQVQGKLNIDLPWNNYKNKTITAENYEELMDEVEEKMKDDDELYYFSYAYLYYWAQGMQESYSDNYNMNDVYENRIYGKTINGLIKEGKQLMKDNNTNIEKFKQEIENFGNTLTIE